VEYAKFLAYFFSDGGPQATCCEMDEMETEKTSLEEYKLLENKLLQHYKVKNMALSTNVCQL
jgi:hypothetical protein